MIEIWIWIHMLSFSSKENLPHITVTEKNQNKQICFWRTKLVWLINLKLLSFFSNENSTHITMTDVLFCLYYKTFAVKYGITYLTTKYKTVSYNRDRGVVVNCRFRLVDSVLSSWFKNWSKSADISVVISVMTENR